MADTAEMSAAEAGRNGGSGTEAHRLALQRYVAAAERAKQKNAAAQMKLQFGLQQASLDLQSKFQSDCLSLKADAIKRSQDLQASIAARQKALQTSIQQEQLQLQAELKSNPILWINGTAQKKMQALQASVASRMQDLQRQAQEEMAALQVDAAKSQQAVQKNLQHEMSALQVRSKNEVSDFIEDAKETYKRTLSELVDPHPSVAHHKLSLDQIRSFVKDGYLVVRQQVPQPLLYEALRLLNYTLSQGIKENEVAHFRRPDVEASPQIVNLLLKSPALALARSLLGPTKPCLGGQLAVRFPGFGTKVSDSSEWDPFAEKTQTFVNMPVFPKGWHIDGIPNLKNGLAPGRIHNFSLLLGILLADVPEEMSGNLLVYPGGHRKMEAWLQKNSPETLLARGVPRDLDLPPPIQITGKAGDIIFASYHMPHSVAPNLSPHIRYCVYFRLTCKDLVEGDASSLQNMFLHWEGVQKLR